MGDISSDEGDIYENRVNVAARAEDIAQSGGDSVSGDHWRQVPRNVAVNFLETVEHSFENIPGMVRPGLPLGSAFRRSPEDEEDQNVWEGRS